MQAAQVAEYPDPLFIDANLFPDLTQSRLFQIGIAVFEFPPRQTDLVAVSPCIFRSFHQDSMPGTSPDE